MQKSSLSNPHQKLGLVVVVVIGLTTLIFGFISIRKSIFEPFVRRPSGITFKSTEQLEKERIESLKNKDTDSDQLTDYDELYIYRTSPFLEDTDSDGDLDGYEVAHGTDPNCPKGKECRQPRTSQVAGGDQPVAVPEETEPVNGTEQPAGTGTGEAPAVDENGPNAAMIQLFTETFGPVESLTSDVIAAKLERMTSAELRAFFIKLGLPASAVEKADDATLRQVFLETIRDIELQAGTAPDSSAATGTPPAAAQ